MKSQILIVLLSLVLPLLALAAPVDTRQFGLIASGMTEAEVQRRLGAPDAIKEHDPVVGVVRGVGSDRIQAYRLLRKSIWIYTGDGQTMHTYIEFENGQVINKWKAR